MKFLTGLLAGLAVVLAVTGCWWGSTGLLQAAIMAATWDDGLEDEGDSE